jgi:hypothetical protein
MSITVSPNCPSIRQVLREQERGCVCLRACVNTRIQRHQVGILLLQLAPLQRTNAYHDKVADEEMLHPKNYVIPVTGVRPHTVWLATGTMNDHTHAKASPQLLLPLKWAGQPASHLKPLIRTLSTK